MEFYVNAKAALFRWSGEKDFCRRSAHHILVPM